MTKKSKSLPQVLDRHIRSLPDKPGVYIMKDDQGAMIYIGKAKSLIKRVKSYFQAGTQHSLKTKLLVDNVVAVEFITTTTEVEALLLESNLIKKNQPYFNVILKDDKHFPFLELTLGDEYPRLIKSRRALKGQSLFYGPYIPEGDANRIRTLVHKLFPLRRCTGKVQPKSRPCPNYEMGLCSSPCTGKIKPEEYGLIVQDVKLFLEGRMEDLLVTMEEKMRQASDELNFEEAIRYRDRIKAVKNSYQKQHIISTRLENRDVIGFSGHESSWVIEPFFIRNGRLLGRRSYFLEDITDDPADILRSFMLQFYSEDIIIPTEIVVPFAPADLDVLSQWLQVQAEKKVNIIIPQRGSKRSLLEMVQKNSELTLLESLKQKGSEHYPVLLEKVGQLLNMGHTPQSIEAYDISNIGGVVAVGSLIVWEKIDFNKKKYRRFKIQNVSGSNDVKMMEEIVERHFQRLMREDQPFPDIVLIDGGKGQVNTINQLFIDLGITSVTLVGLAKGRSKKKLPRKLRPLDRDYLVLPGSQLIEPKDIPQDCYLFFQRIRDEAHRFAIEYHRKLREKRHFRSILEEIPGIGAKRKKALFAHFGSLQQIMDATEQELHAVRGIDRTTAKTLFSFFNHVHSP